MKIEASDIDISKLLKMGVIVIPRFQRPYSWKSENVREFWSDITNSQDGEYFIGSMVMYSMKQDKFGVVDGQQRLTTLTILLCAIRDHFAELEEEELAHGVHNYIETRDRDNVKSFILKTETSYPYLQDKIQRFGEPELEVEPKEEEKRLQQAYDALYRYVETFSRQGIDGLISREEKKAFRINSLKALREKIFNLKVIRVELDDEDDAYTIFETLNTRGQDLTLSDLLKNSIGSLVQRDGDVDVLKQHWEEITANIRNCGDLAKLDTFFVHSWNSRFPATTKQRAFKAFKKKLKEGVDAAGDGMARSIGISHLRSFNADSKRYIRIYQPKKSFPKYQYLLEDALTALRIFGVEQQTSYNIALLRAFDEKRLSYRSLRRALLFVENFHFKFNSVTSQRSSGSIAAIYNRAARSITECQDTNAVGQAISDLNTELREKAPSLEEFSLGFRSISYQTHGRSNSLIKYILAKLSQHEKLQFDASLDRLTVEHLHPQSKNTGPWNDATINSIGNLILVSESRNGILADKDYSEKYRAFAAWPNSIPEFVTNNANWDPQTAAERAQQMADIAYNEVWKL